MQKSALLGSAHILRKVLEVWGLGMRLDWIFLPRENPCAKFYIIIIIIIIRPELKTGIDFANIGLELDIFRGNNGSAWIYLSFSIPNE